MLIFSVSFQTLTETLKVKSFQNSRDAQGHSDAQGGAPDTRVFADQTARKARVLVTIVSHVKRSLHQTRRGNEVPGKTGTT